MLSFVLSVSFYLLLTILTLSYFEQRNTSRRTSLDRTFTVINFTNALIATSLSSTVLLSMENKSRLVIYGEKPSQLSLWTIESVCGYIVVEMTLLLTAHFRLSPYQWQSVKEDYFLMELFHTVAILGLSTVMWYGEGYPLAMWEIWTELTSIGLGLEDFLYHYNWTHQSTKINKIRSFFSFVNRCLFILQRVLLCLWLTWLGYNQLVWRHYHRLVQFIILIIGTLLNIVIAFVLW